MSHAARVGYYLWGGPGTVRMLRTKYFHPRIDEESFLRAYDEDSLRAARDIFGVTDVWATLSWGFSDATEREDWDFLERRVDTFHRLGMRVHGYVQGPNVVVADFPHADWYCSTPQGHRIPYHRGRHLTCVNAPAFQSFFLQRVQRACTLPLDGIYIDNAFMGQLGVPGAPRSFVGCACAHCRALFAQQYDDVIPHRTHPDHPTTQQYLSFRAGSLVALLQRAADIAHAAGKEFGSNSLDPRFDDRRTYGMDLAALCRMQDYLLFETVTHPDGKTRGNGAVRAAMEALRPSVPVFVVSYKRGIGFDAQYAQRDVDAVFSEANTIGYRPCIKATEFVTRGTWHNLRPAGWTAPRVQPIAVPAHVPVQGGRWHALAGWMRDRFPSLVSLYYEHRLARRLGGWMERAVLG